MILQRYKIVFGGTIGAGKSAAIRALSDTSVLSTEALNTDREASAKTLTTVGIDYGEIRLDDEITIGLYGTPGQNRFDFMWEIVCKGALGIIILIDHTRPERLQDLDFYLNAFEKYSHNLVIGVTHLDKQDDQMLKIYRDWFAVRQLNYPLFVVDARQKDDVLLMTEALIATAEINSLNVEN
jgi:uncharacterized protein